MFQLPMTPLGTFKIVLEIHEDKGYNRIEMLPRPMLDLQGEPNLIVYTAVNSDGQVLQILAHEPKKGWVEHDPKRHRPENFQKPAPKPAPKPEPTGPDNLHLKSEVAMVSMESAPKPEPTLSPRDERRLRRKKRRPIPPAGPDSVKVESAPSPKGGKVVAAKVSNHVEPKQSMAPPTKVKTMPLPPKSTPPNPKDQ